MTEILNFRLYLLVTTLFFGGCSICDNCDDQAYSGYGGRWQRLDRYHGRVGSVFSEAGAPVIDHSDQSVEIVRSPGAIIDPAIDKPQSVDFPELNNSNGELRETDPSVMELMPPILEAY